MSVKVTIDKSKEPVEQVYPYEDLKFLPRGTLVKAGSDGEYENYYLVTSPEELHVYLDDRYIEAAKAILWKNLKFKICNHKIKININ